jgi:hypothetical protein
LSPVRAARFWFIRESRSRATLGQNALKAAAHGVVDQPAISAGQQLTMSMS